MIETVAETGSTNADFLARIDANEVLHEGTWLVADRQGSGRGRQGRVWQDASGNFMGSTPVAVKPDDPPPHTLSLVAGLAVYEATAPLIPPTARAALKWPNDLLLNDAKLSGILLERSRDTIIVGIGVNLFKAPVLPERKTIALSHFGPAPDRDMFAQSLVERFAQELERWRTYGLDLLIRRWMQAAHSPGTLLTVMPPGEEPLSGSFAGLTNEGNLCLALPDGGERVIHAGDVVLQQEIR
ncbi:biotin--[acetyl-CoA-carboxylase] ligase [Erythrobacter litoralis]|uniref:biotin--[acetyl-CoA-carboxylase] ligase n=1 Tax=Erythrobacter litoralis TaxID=39960 RepID=UPI002435716E|nr:biotin--[acetyl-CoA-carboxylase] ligase [Erythrobacter litoralis]MDG6078239.1 biotin--[acetyl-CoA-carboxylase] ligase [Erythrobacter litoralis]